MPKKPAWNIQFCDGLHVFRDGIPVERLSSRKAALLLACLALLPGRSFARETLMERLWPEEDTSTTRDRFKQTLALLRRVLEPPGMAPGSCLVADRGQVRLNAETVASDVGHFQESLRQASRTPDPERAIALLTEAVTLCHGELLPGFADDWVEAERRRLEQARRNALARLSTLLAQAGRMEEATAHALDLVNLDPLDEPARCRLMELYRAAGRFSEVERQYRELEMALKEALGVAPSAEARRLREDIRSADHSFAPDLRASAMQARDGGEGHAGRASAAPSAATPPASWPAPLTRFFGRSEEIRYLLTALSPHAAATETRRLLTLTGPGGCGKTRLALEVSDRLREAFVGAVWVVPTAGIQSGDQVAVAIADALSLPRVAGGDPLPRIAAALAQAPSLLVLDNFELASDEGGLVLVRLLSLVPPLRCLVTSRQPLYVGGEEVYAVAPLPVPEGDAALAESPSVQLFLDRAQAARRDFRLTVENAEAVRGICVRLEGIPLAIELAAAQAEVLTPAQIEQRLERRLDFLVSRRRDVDPRHRSLRAAIEDSYRLLAPEQQRLFAHLSAFHGAFAPEAVEAVASPDSADVIDLLAGLNSRSLLLTEDVGAEMRYRLLDSLRDFADEFLSTEERAEVLRRHDSYFLMVAEAAASALQGEDAPTRARSLEADLDDLRAVLARALGDGPHARKEEASALRLTTALHRYWELRGRHHEGLGWFERLREAFPVRRTLPWALALEAEGGLRDAFGQHAAARPLLEESLALFREAGDRVGIARALCGLGEALCSIGDSAAAEPAFVESLSLLADEGQGDLSVRGRGVGGLARVALERGNFEASARLYAESDALYRRAGNRRGMAWATHMQGTVAIRRDDGTAARVYFEQALGLFLLLGDELSTLHALMNLAETVARSDPEAAESYYAQALPYCRRTGSLDWERHCRCRLGKRAFLRGEDGVAEEQYAGALVATLAAAGTVSALEPLYYLVHLAARQGQAARAISLFGAATALAQECGVTYPPPDDAEYAAAVARSRTTLGAAQADLLLTRARIEGWRETARRALEHR